MCPSVDMVSLDENCESNHEGYLWWNISDRDKPGKNSSCNSEYTNNAQYRFHILITYMRSIKWRSCYISCTQHIFLWAVLKWLVVLCEIWNIQHINWFWHIGRNFWFNLNIYSMHQNYLIQGKQHIWVISPFAHWMNNSLSLLQVYASHSCFKDVTMVYRFELQSLGRVSTLSTNNMTVQ